MESFWKKELIDGTIELGTDTMVSLGQASWTKGRQDIAQVALYFGGRLVSIRAEIPEDCTWRLLDRSIASTLTGETTRIERIIEVTFGRHSRLKLKRLDVLSSIRQTAFELQSGPPEELKDYEKVLIEIDQSGTLQVRYK